MNGASIIHTNRNQWLESPVGATSNITLPISDLVKATVPGLSREQFGGMLQVCVLNKQYDDMTTRNSVIHLEGRAVPLTFRHQPFGRKDESMLRRTFHLLVIGSACRRQTVNGVELSKGKNSGLSSHSSTPSYKSTTNGQVVIVCTTAKVPPSEASPRHILKNQWTVALRVLLRKISALTVSILLLPSGPSRTQDQNPTAHGIAGQKVFLLAQTEAVYPGHLQSRRRT